MDIMNWLFRKRNTPVDPLINIDERKVWGIWAPIKTKLRYQIMSMKLRVPTSTLVCHVLDSWFEDNYEDIFDDDVRKHELGDYLARKMRHKN